MFHALTFFIQSFFLCYLFTVVRCVEIAEPQNGQVNIESTRYQGIAQYECNTGYELVGEDVRKCQINGHWSGTPPQCIGKFFGNLQYCCN